MARRARATPARRRGPSRGAARRRDPSRTSSALRPPPPARPVPLILGLRARRRGSAIDVTWRTDLRAKPDDFLVTGTATRSGAPLALATSDAERSSRRFQLTLRPSTGVEFVSVAVATETLRIVERATARVR